MSRKRTLLSDICQQKRKKINSGNENGSTKDPDVPGDTSTALLFLASIFPVEKFSCRLPAIVMKHQIYPFVPNRTEVDKHLNEMQNTAEIRLFQLGNNKDEIAVVYMKDYLKHIEKCCGNHPTVDFFMKNVVTKHPELSYSKEVLLKQYGLIEENISELIQQGVLTSRDVGCYWLSVPGFGEFVKTFLFGRRATLQYVRRTKYKEILQSDLEQRKLPKKAVLGILYHIYDIIGSEFVTCVQTSAGSVLRLQPD